MQLSETEGCNWPRLYYLSMASMIAAGFLAIVLDSAAPTAQAATAVPGCPSGCMPPLYCNNATGKCEGRAAKLDVPDMAVCEETAFRRYGDANTTK